MGGGGGVVLGWQTILDNDSACSFADYAFTVDVPRRSPKLAPIRCFVRDVHEGGREDYLDCAVT